MAEDSIASISLYSLISESIKHTNMDKIQIKESESSESYSILESLDQEKIIEENKEPNNTSPNPKDILDLNQILCALDFWKSEFEHLQNQNRKDVEEIKDGWRRKINKLTLSKNDISTGNIKDILSEISELCIKIELNIKNNSQTELENINEKFKNIKTKLVENLQYQSQDYDKLQERYENFLFSNFDDKAIVNELSTKGKTIIIQKILFIH